MFLKMYPNVWFVKSLPLKNRTLENPVCSSAGAVGHPSAGHGSCCHLARSPQPLELGKARLPLPAGTLENFHQENMLKEWSIDMGGSCV